MEKTPAKRFSMVVATETEAHFPEVGTKSFQNFRK